MVKYRVLLRKMPNRKWQIWVAVIPLMSREAPDAVPLVKHAGKLSIDRARLHMKAHEKLPFNTLPTAEFDTKKEAEGVAFPLGKYILKLGDFMHSWLDVETG